MNFFYELISEKHAVTLPTAMLISILEVTFIALDWSFCFWCARKSPLKRYYITVGFFVAGVLFCLNSLYLNLTTSDPTTAPFALFCAGLANFNLDWVGHILDKKLHFDLFFQANWHFAFLIYAATVILLVATTYYRRYRVMRIRSFSSNTSLNADWQHRIAVFCNALNIKQHVSVVDSPLVRRSMFYTFGESFVLLPSASLNQKPTKETDIAALEALQGVKSKEFWFRITLWTTVFCFAFNPAIWFLGWQVFVQRRRLLRYRAKEIQQSMIDELYPKN